MLRQLVSVNLAMIVCATLISTNANAASITFTAEGGRVKSVGDPIKFVATLHPDALGSKFEGLDRTQPGSRGFTHDQNELSYVTQSLINVGVYHTIPTVIAYFEFSVLQGLIEDTKPDFEKVVALIWDRNSVRTPITSTGGIDVIPPPAQGAPEPLTMFGAVAAIGYGAILKRESSKKRKANHHIE